MHDFPFTRPASGWYQVGWSGEYSPGTVKPLRYFERELVCYRTAGGTLHVSDAFCLHFGAHLGYGGTVEGDCIVCPFHGWKWGPDGKNVDIPYSAPERMKLKIRQWTVQEIDGLVLLWFGANGEAPTWEPPRFLPADSNLDEDFWAIYPDTTHCFPGLKFPPQLATENAVDAAHFRYVHQAGSVPPITKVEATEHTFRTEMSFTYGGERGTTWATPHGPVPGRMTTICHGPGLIQAELKAFDTVYTMAGTTPVDAGTSDQRATIWVPKVRGDGSPLSEEIRDRWFKQQQHQHAADYPIFENLRYVARPPLARTELEGFRALRKWIEDKYPVAGPDEVAQPAALR